MGISVAEYRKRTDQGEVRTKRIKKPTAEKVTQTQCIEYLKLKKFYVIRNQQGMGSHKGLSDVTAISPNGDVYWIEFKAPKGVLSEYQEDFQAELNARYQYYWVIKSLDELLDKLSNNVEQR